MGLIKLQNLLLGRVPIFWVGPVFNSPRPSRDGEKALGLRKRQNLLLGRVPIVWVGPVFNCPRPSHDGEEALGQVVHFFMIIVEKMAKARATLALLRSAFPPPRALPSLPPPPPPNLSKKYMKCF